MEITLNLSAESVDDAAKRLRKYADRLRDIEGSVGIELANEGAAYARSIAPDYRIPITATGSGGLWRITAGGFTRTDARSKEWQMSPALFEFGTGVVGAGTYPKSPFPAPNYVYGAGTPDHRDAHEGNTWYYYDTDPQNASSTQGEPARPFMFNTALWLRQNAARIVKERLDDRY